MNTPIDSEKTVEIIKKMKLAKIGKYKKLESMIKKNQKGRNTKSRRVRILFEFNKNL